MIKYNNTINLYNKSGILILDNSSLTTYGECERKFLFRNILALRDPLTKPAITFGSAFHAGLEQYYSNQPYTSCLEAFVKAAMHEHSKIQISRQEGNDATQRTEFSLEFGAELLKRYIERYPLEREYVLPITFHNRLLLEKGFAIDLPNGILIGRIDFIGRKTLDKSKILVVEHKTTSMVIGPSYLGQYNPNNQVASYLCAANALLPEHPPEAALINIIRVKDYKRGDPETNRDKLFARIETGRTPEFLEQHLQHVNYMMKQVKDSIEVGFDGFPQRTHSCVSRYGECEYKKLCMAKNQNTIQSLASTAYERGVYTPYDVLENVDEVVDVDVTKNRRVEIKSKEEFIRN